MSNGTFLMPLLIILTASTLVPPCENRFIYLISLCLMLKMVLPGAANAHLPCFYAVSRLGSIFGSLKRSMAIFVPFFALNAFLKLFLTKI